ncbi:MAG TPA: ATP synthase F1 subunit gamma [Perlabentimonas sp.]|nr:ATP synthase F1 subunit gamma [Bacteroidales bacterium]MDD4673484.1 ATP synthase F1 subunit gamma [Bacteroidales bacterium]MDY0348342.1 ATP synthase F1 subunit gamma [Tenuifilaceae bacterium]HZJ74376.1 ATP synthase F1 subunit gamma [Perlabentimonas sp.]
MSLKEIRTRISSIASTQKITSAMKMVSAAKFHRAQDTFFRFQTYSQKLNDVFLQVSGAADGSWVDRWFNEPQQLKRIALVVLSSNSSMCAGFNQNIAKQLADSGSEIFQDIWNTENVQIFALGKKGAQLLNRKGIETCFVDEEIVHTTNYDSAIKFCTEKLLNPFEQGTYDAVYIVYNEFENPAVQQPAINRFLPYVKPQEETDGRDSSFEVPEITFEPSKKSILETIIPMALKTFFYEKVLENAIGEHGARMTAMHQATENAIELSKELKLQYNKARQAAITSEILEIVSGAEALNG